MIPPIPETRDEREFAKLVNDRLRRITSELDQRFKRGQDLDLGGFRIKNPGDPIDPNDAISRAAADRRYLGQRPAAVTGTTVVAAGTAGSAVVTFSPLLDQYGQFSVSNVAITGATGIGTFKGVTVVPVYVDEIAAPDDWVSINSDSGTTDPLTIAVTAGPAPTIVVGDWVLFNDPGHYELAQVTAIAGADYTLKRSWPGDNPANAIFSSTRENHLSGTKLYPARTAKFPFAPASADYDAGSDTITVPDQLDCWLPNACVVAILAAAQFGEDTGPWTVANTALATVPGLRTLHGGNYTFEIAGTVSVGQTSREKRIQFESSVRVAFARATTAPTGAAMTIVLEESANGSSWTTIETLTIAAGATESFSTAPGQRRAPYSGSWPFAVLPVDYRLRARITGVGSSVAGANVTIEVYT